MFINRAPNYKMIFIYILYSMSLLSPSRGIKKVGGEELDVFDRVNVRSSWDVFDRVKKF